jgi:hypothetical protein
VAVEQNICRKKGDTPRNRNWTLKVRIGNLEFIYFCFVLLKVFEKESLHYMSLLGVCLG